MSVMDHNSFPTLLSALYTEIIEQQLASVQDLRPLIYYMTTSDRLEERYSAVGELATWPEFTGELTSQQSYEQYETTFRPREYATMTIVTRRMVDDDLSGVLNGVRFRPMVRASLVTQQKHATRMFEMLGSVDSYWSIFSEGVAIASTAHTTRTPNVSTTTGFSNLTTAPLSPTALRAALIAGRKIKNDQGDRADISYDELFVPVDLVPRANEILRTIAGLDTPYGNENQESSARSGVQKVIGLPYWSSATNWALSNSMLREDMCLWIDRVEPEYGRITEFDTLQIKSRGYMRYGVATRGWRQFYCGVVS